MLSSLAEARGNSSDSGLEEEAATTLSPAARQLGTGFLCGVWAEGLSVLATFAPTP